MTYTDRVIPAILLKAWSKQTGPENWQHWLGRMRLLKKVALQMSPQYQQNTLASPASVKCIDETHGLGTAKKTLLGKHRQQLEIFVLQFRERKGNTMEIAGPCAERQDGCSGQSPTCRVGRRVSCRLCQLSIWVNREAQGLQDCWHQLMRERSRHSTFQLWVMTREIWKRD